MSMPLVSWWRRKPRSLEPVLHELVERLRQHAGASLRAIILYGSAARDRYHPAKSNLNVLVVIAGRDAAFWGRLQSFAARWLRHDIGLPIFFTEPELRDWAQSFPIEFLDIQTHHRMLHGEDVVAPLVIDHAHLRWQCESELRGKLLRLRQAFMAPLRRDELQGLLERTITSLLPVFQALVHLTGETLPASRHAMIRALSRAYAVPDDAFTALLQLKVGHERTPRAPLRELFAQSLASLEQLAVAVDRRAVAPPHA